MTTISVAIIYRNNNIYSNIYEYIKQLFINNSCKVDVYDMSHHNDNTNVAFNHELIKNSLKCEIIYHKMREKSIFSIREMIYNSLTDNEKIKIYDACLNIENSDILNYDKNAYILLKNNDIGVPYLFYYNNEKDKLPQYDFLSIESYKNNSIVLKTPVIIDSNFADNLFFNSISKYDIVDRLFLKYITNKIMLNSDERALYTSNYNKQDFLNSIELLNLDSAVNDFKNNRPINKTFISYDCYYKFWIIFTIYTDNEILESNIMLNISDKMSNSILYIDENTQIKIALKIIELLIKINKKIDIYTIPTWIKKYDLDILDEYYDNSIETPELIEHDKVIFGNDIKLIDKYTFIIGNDLLKKEGDKIKYLNKDIGQYKQYALLDHRNSNICNELLLLVSLNPIKFKILNSESFFTHNKNCDMKYNELLGNFVYINNKYVGLVKCSKNSYRLLIFSDGLDILDYSYKMYVPYENIIGLYNENDDIYFISLNDKIYHKHKLDTVILYTELIPSIEPIYNLNLQINNRTNIKLIIEGYDNILSEYESFKFNKDEDVLATINYFYRKKLIKNNNKYYYHNQFIYLPEKNINVTKLHDVYFHESVLNDQLLIDMLRSHGITEGSEYTNCKYMLISQKTLENLNSLELSKIIDSNTLIISLIENEDVENNSFVKTYTSDKNITKLYLFNIAKNDSYITFIIDKIFEEDQYSAREQFMEIDKQTIFNETNIYKTVLDIVNKKQSHFQNIKLDVNNSEIAQNIKQKLFNNSSKYQKIINYIINKKYDANIGYINGCKIPDNIDKINFLGTEMEYSKITENILDIIFIQNKDVLDNISFEKNDILVFDLSDNDLFMT